MNPTLRNNGEQMVTVRTEHHLFRAEVVDLIACALSAGEEFTTARAIGDRVREELAAYGAAGAEVAYERIDTTDHSTEHWQAAADDLLTTVLPDWTA